MEIKPCANCGGKADLFYIGTAIIRYFVSCKKCKIKTVDNINPDLSIYIWNSHVEINRSEADRWLKEATEQRARAELAEAQRDELSEALEQAKRMMAYAGKIQ